MIVLSPTISIIVPVYNCEKYLDKCIDSILKQSVVDFELILINDGSIDNSLLICEKYASVDNRVKIITQDNKGVSSARNAGLDIAKGKFVTFVDSDDWISTEMLSQLYKLTVANDTDLTVCCLKRVMDNGSFIGKTDFGISKIINCNNLKADDFYLLLKSYAIFQPVCKLFKLATINKNNLRFDINLSFGEDFSFNLAYFQYISKIYILNSSLYYYRNNISSLSSTFNDKKAKSFVTSKEILFNYVVTKGILVNDVKDFIIKNILLDYKDCTIQILRSNLETPVKNRNYIILNSCNALNESLKLMDSILLNPLDRVGLRSNKLWLWKVLNILYFIHGKLNSVYIRYKRVYGK
jgi:glycosyltransferase involved in cell wall biosynthesis